MAEIESRELEDIIELLGSGDDPEKVLRRFLDLIEGLALRFAQKGKKPDKAARQELHLIVERYLQV